MSRLFFQVLTGSGFFLIFILSRRSWKRHLENILLLIAAALGGASLFSDSAEEFWRLYSGALLITGFGLEITAREWQGRACLRLGLLVPVIVFAASMGLGSPLLSAQEVANLVLCLFVLGIVSDAPIVFREGVELTSAHPLRALRVLLTTSLSAFYFHNYFPTDKVQPDLLFWRWLVTGLGGALMLLSFLNRDPRRRQILMGSWLSAFAFWGLVSGVKATQFIGVCVGALGALALVLAGDEGFQAEDRKNLLIKLGFAAVPGTFLFSAIAFFFIARQPGDGPFLVIWLCGLCLHWYGVSRDSWDDELTTRAAWGPRQRFALFLVVGGASLLLFVQNLNAVVEALP